MRYVGVLNSVEEEILTNQDVEYYVTNGGEIYSIDGSTRTLMFDGTDWVGGELVFPEEYADAITNFVWSDVSGVHISTEKDDATTSGVKNVLLDSNGLYLRDGIANHAVFEADRIDLGLDTDAPVAVLTILGRSGALIGQETFTLDGVVHRDITLQSNGSLCLEAYYNTSTKTTSQLILDDGCILLRPKFTADVIDGKDVYPTALSTSKRVYLLAKANGHSLYDVTREIMNEHTDASVTVSHNNRSNTLTIRRAGNVVTASMHGVFGINAQNTLVTMGGTIPSGYRPIDSTYVNIVNVSNSKPTDTSRWVFESGGNIKVTTGAPANTLREYYIDATWITSENMPS